MRRTHPTYELLSRAADRELPATEAMELNAHLAECRECREEVDFMVDLRRRLRELSGPTPPATLLPEILGRRSAGERRILDLGDVWTDEHARGRVRPAVPAAAALVAAAGGFALFAASGIEAGANQLSFDVSESGAVQGVEFKTGGRLSAEPLLQARGVYFESAHEPWREVAPVEVKLTLESRRAGVFVSEERLPSSVVYARFAVEDASGDLVEDGGGRWEYVALGADGAPSFDALLMKARAEVAAENHAAARETTELLTTRFADRPAAWFWRLTVEKNGVEEPGWRARHERRLARFRQTLRPDASPAHVATLAWYAFELENGPAYMELTERLAASAPDHPVASQARAMTALTGQPAETLANLEALWSTYGSASSDVFPTAMDQARALGDAGAAVRWFDRWISANPMERLVAARALASIPVASAEVDRRIEETLRWIDRGHAPRELGRSASQHRRTLDLQKLSLLAVIAGSLREAGHADEAYEALSSLAHLAWRPELLALMADLATETGHERTAIRYHLLASVVPSRGAERDDHHVLALRSLGIEGPELAVRQRAAWSELEARMLLAGDPLHTPASIIVESGAGLSQDIVSLLGPRATIIHLGSPESMLTIDRVARSASSCDELSARGVRILAVSHDQLDSVEADTSASCFEGWFFDRHREARRALDARLYGEIIVVDGAGLVRYRGSDADDAYRAALLLAGPA